MIPNVRPVQPRARGRSTSRRVEVMVPGPAFHRNIVPTATCPLRETFLTSGFHLASRGYLL